MDEMSPHIPWPDPEFKFLDEEERARRLDRLLADQPEGPLWVFAFGSLMWNPCFAHDRSETAVFDGWERKFHIWTTRARGTPERPGLGLCLEEGEAQCKGIAYRLLSENAAQDWRRLWDREMVSGIYHAVWADVTLQTGELVKALTFVVDRNHPQYAGGMPVDTMSEIIAGAAGHYGRCRDYLANTVAEMGKLGLIDDHLNELLNLVDQRMQTSEAEA